MINLKKIIFLIIVIFCNYLLITSVVFTFSYLSLLKGKTYDWFWVKSIQKKIYFKGQRNIWQYKNDCTTFDKDLFYKPRLGECKFSNPEFNTILNFNDFIRINDLSSKNLENNNPIIVLGDSIAMGWGVNDNETFSYQLEKISKRKVFNMGVSSYGTVREIKKLKLSPYYDNSKTIIIQYHINDLGENKELDFKKVYLEKDFIKTFRDTSLKSSNIKFILGNFKSSIRLFFSDIIDVIFRDKNLELINFDIDKKYLEKVIKDNINLNEKNIIVFLPVQPWQKVINFPKSNNQIKYVLIPLNKSQYFIIDDHPNKKGHFEIAKVLNKFLSTL